MYKTIILILSLISSTLSFSTLVDKDLYEKLDTPSLNKQVLDRALKGLSEINTKNKDIITIIDYTKSSNEKRLFVIDLKKEEVLFDTYVAHGKNTGGEFATKFSNTFDSKQSSVGFFKTSSTYIGGNGYSMKMDGLEKGINDHARARTIVFHGAKYVAESFIKKYGRLGRSWGCPAVPVNESRPIIDTIKNGSIVYINGDLKNYNKKTHF